MEQGKNSLTCPKKNSAAKSLKELRKEKADKRKSTQLLRQQLKQFEKQMASLTAHCKQLKDKLSDNQFYEEASYQEITQLQIKLVNYETSLVKTEESWLILCQELEAAEAE